MTDWRCHCGKIEGEHYHIQDAPLMVAEIKTLQQRVEELEAWVAHVEAPAETSRLHLTPGQIETITKGRR